MGTGCQGGGVIGTRIGLESKSCKPERMEEEKAGLEFPSECTVGALEADRRGTLQVPGPPSGSSADRCF